MIKRFLGFLIVKTILIFGWTMIVYSIGNIFIKETGILDAIEYAVCINVIGNAIVYNINLYWNER